MNTRRVTAYGAMGGAGLGGFVWVVVAGVLIHDPLIWGLGALAALGVSIGGAQALLRYPTRTLTVVGVVALVVALADFAFLAAVLPRLPEEDAGLYFGTSRTAFRAVRPFLWLAGVAGPVCALWDFLRSKRVP